MYVEGIRFCLDRLWLKWIMGKESLFQINNFLVNSTICLYIFILRLKIDTNYY